ncbi:MAG: hypothetical protein ABIO94_10975 [Opitutaceae bacterium]
MFLTGAPHLFLRRSCAAHEERKRSGTSIVELGLDYPRTLNEALTITGGTGRFVGATGTLLVSGIDEESLTDTIQIHGAILTPGSLLGGLLK